MQYKTAAVVPTQGLPSWLVSHVRAARAPVARSNTVQPYLGQPDVALSALCTRLQAAAAITEPTAVTVADAEQAAVVCFLACLATCMLMHQLI